MKNIKAFLRKDREYESNVGLYRKKFNIKIKDLAGAVGCGPTAIIRLQNGMDSPFYENSQRYGGVSHSAGDIRPYVKKMMFLFNVSLPKLFPRYACEFKRKENRFVSFDDYMKEGGEKFYIDSGFEKVDRKMAIEKLWEVVGENISERSKRILEKRYYEEWTLEEIADIEICSRERVSQIEKITLNKIRNLLYNVPGLTKSLKEYRS